MQVHHTNKKKIGWGIVLASLTCLMQPVAHAQSEVEILDSVRACQNLTGMSSRLACYDRILPPTAGSAATVEAVDRGNRASLPVTREAELEATVAELEEQLVRETGAIIPTAQIIEVERPSVRTSRLVAADGRVFVESNPTTIVRWPETPFDVDINRSITGTITLRAIGVSRDRGQGRGVRVVQER
ncbi:hypothetical protein JYT97_01885 [Haliea sp. AH-315-K21]|uniref:Uncharacterized protein n=1 Tax=SAR86 cluster bacterium TaxID=2030880 RepID=A0A2A5CCF8_9GAMM|nr:hypothetical protein [Haliea sp. AH-315-K21]PCJ41215.1 MAG: hypothetical protein COA71_09260 [SAR86 cluster bacterium]